MFEDYLDENLNTIISLSDVVSIAINLYELGDYNWSLEIIGAPIFDDGNADWACFEVFEVVTTRKNQLFWKEETDWENILKSKIKELENYLKTGRFTRELKDCEAVAIGFVDGDLEIIYQK